MKVIWSTVLSPDWDYDVETGSEGSSKEKPRHVRGSDSGYFDLFADEVCLGV